MIYRISIEYLGIDYLEQFFTESPKPEVLSDRLISFVDMGDPYEPERIIRYIPLTNRVKQIIVDKIKEDAY